MTDAKQPPAGEGPASDPSSSTGRLDALAEATWVSMRQYGIAPTPDNYKVWFAFCGTDQPELTRRVGAVLQAGGSILPEMLTNLYGEFFGNPLDVTMIKSGAQALQHIADEVVDRVSQDASVLATFGESLAAALGSLGPGVSVADLQQAGATVSHATEEVRDRLVALEQLFAASVRKIVVLRDRLVKAEHEATRDALTGLYNRRMFDSVLIRAAEQATHERGNLSLLLLDIDHFKRFNDTHGHVVGDNVLRLIGGILLNQVKGRDTAARFGGEEFVVILPGADLVGAITLAEQIRRTLSGRPIVNRSSNKSLGIVTCSIGVAQFRPAEAVMDTIARADRALYVAKRSGRNAVRAES